MPPEWTELPSFCSVYALGLVVQSENWTVDRRPTPTRYFRATGLQCLSTVLSLLVSWIGFRLQMLPVLNHRMMASRRCPGEQTLTPNIRHKCSSRTGLNSHRQAQCFPSREGSTFPFVLYFFVNLCICISRVKLTCLSTI